MYILDGCWHFATCMRRGRIGQGCKQLIGDHCWESLQSRGMLSAPIFSTPKAVPLLFGNGNKCKSCCAISIEQLPLVCVLFRVIEGHNSEETGFGGDHNPFRFSIHHLWMHTYSMWELNGVENIAHRMEGLTCLRSRGCLMLYPFPVGFVKLLWRTKRRRMQLRGRREC